MRISKIIGKTDEPVDNNTKIGEIKAQGLAFSVSLCTKTVYNIIDRGDFHRLWINNYPRKPFNYETANQQYLKVS